MNRREILVITSVSLAVRLIIAIMFGVRDGADTAGYVEAAERWTGSGWSLATLLNESRRSPLFVATLGVLRSLFLEWRFALVAFQTLLSAALPLAVFGAALRGGVSRRGAWVAALITIASYELSRWSAYVLTDALFVLLSGAALCATIVALATRSWRWAMVVGIALAGALFARPIGPAVAIAVLTAACVVRPISRAVVIAALGASTLFAASILSVRSEVRRPQPLRVCTHLAAGRVIWGSEAFSVQPPPGLAVTDESPTLPCLTRVAMEHPGHVANVFVRRAIVYWMPVYPNYSRAHNLANVLLLAVPIALAAVALVRHRSAFRSDVVRLVCGCFVVSFWIFHIVTWSEGDHRFLAPVLPAIYLLAGARLADAPGVTRATAQTPKRTA